MSLFVVLLVLGVVASQCGLGVVADLYDNGMYPEPDPYQNPQQIRRNCAQLGAECGPGMMLCCRGLACNTGKGGLIGQCVRAGY